MNLESIEILPNGGLVTTRQLKAVDAKTVGDSRGGGNSLSTQQRTFINPRELALYPSILENFDGTPADNADKNSTVYVGWEASKLRPLEVGTFRLWSYM